MTESNDEQYLNKQLHKSKRKILDILGWNSSDFKSDDDNVIHNVWLKELKDKRSKEFDLSKIEPNQVLPESILNGLVNYPHINFIEDGIMWQTQREFEIGYDLQSERITIPIRDKNGCLIGIKGRATKDEDSKNFKYLSLYNFHKSKDWFNLHRSLPSILENNEVICFESEKACLKSYQMGVYNTVSQMGSSITKIQAEMLKRISPNLKIILGYDQDIDIEGVKQMAKVFGSYDNLYGIIDTKGFLDEKMSPVDKDFQTFKTLYNHHCFKIP